MVITRKIFTFQTHAKHGTKKKCSNTYSIVKILFISVLEVCRCGAAIWEYCTWVWKSVFTLRIFWGKPEILSRIGKRNPSANASTATTSICTVSSCIIFSVVMLLLCTLTPLPGYLQSVNMWKTAWLIWAEHMAVVTWWCTGEKISPLLFLWGLTSVKFLKPFKSC